MEIRRARDEDVQELAEMRWHSRVDEDREAPRTTRECFVAECTAFLRRGFASGMHVAWIAVENGRIVSHVLIQKVQMVPRPYKLQDMFGYVTNAYTRPNRRNEGIGRSVMQHVIEWAHGEDLELLIVWPSIRAVPFYRRLGFDAQNDVMQLTLRPYYEEDAPRRLDAERRRS